MLIQRGTVPDSLEHRLTWCPFVPHENKEEHDTTVMIAISHGCQVWRDGGGRGRREGRREERRERRRVGRKDMGFSSVIILRCAVPLPLFMFLSGGGL